MLRCGLRQRKQCTYLSTLACINSAHKAKYDLHSTAAKWQPSALQSVAIAEKDRSEGWQSIVRSLQQVFGGGQRAFNASALTLEEPNGKSGTKTFHLESQLKQLENVPEMPRRGGQEVWEVRTAAAGLDFLQKLL